MASDPAAATDEFVIVCVRCDQRLIAQRAWIDREVQCAHCRCALAVPPPRHDGEPVIANLASSAREHTFNFACKRCRSVLESSPNLSDEPGRCPTCGARFRIPRFDFRTGLPDDYVLLDSNEQDPVPMHAYAASGQQAPEIVTRADGQPQIRCRRCGSLCAITANSCPACGVPFTIEGAAGSPVGRDDARAIAALVLGIVSLPLCAIFVPAILAMILGISSIARGSAENRRSGAAIAGAGLGLFSAILGLILHLFV
jgi:hypothetical protein